MDYNYYGGYDSYSNASAFAGVGIAFIVIFSLAMIALAVFTLIANYKLFKKMGIDGWKAFIPVVNNYLQMGATGVNQKWLIVLTFGYFVMIIPFLGWIAYIAAALYLQVLISVSLAKSFGKDTAFAVGLFFLYPIFLMILAFGSAKYVGKRPMNDVIFSTEEALKQTDEVKEVKKSAVKTNECPNCKTKITKDTAYCTNCGSKL